MASKKSKKTSGHKAKTHRSKFERITAPGEVRGDWWNVEDNSYHDSVAPLISAIKDDQARRREYNELFYSMYTGSGVSSLDGAQYSEARTGSGDMKVNFARTICAAANSKLAQSKARILYLTEGGNWKQRSRAKRITKIVNGTFFSSGFYNVNQAAQLDSTWCDLAAVFFFADDKEVKCERVPGSEILVDYMDARYGDPSCLHRVKSTPRSELIERYPEFEKEILEAPLSNGARRTGSRWITDAADVTYSWKKSSSDAVGRYAVTIETATLEHHDYKKDYFPFVFHKWEPEPLGFYGKSICGILAGIQYNINKVTRDIQEHIDLSTGFVALEAGSGISKQVMTNQIWRIAEFANTPPQYIAPPAFQVEKLQWLDWLINRGHEDTGLSQLFVSAQKPSGLNSGKALREYNDQNSERFQITEQRFEQTFVDAANIITGIYEDIYDDGGDFEVRAHGTKLIETVSWKAARMDQKEYVVRPIPTSFLPNTPAAKLETVQEMMQGGLLSREEGMLLLDYPDLERVGRYSQSSMLNIERMIDIMTDPDEPKPQTPHSLMNLNEAFRLAQAAYNDAELSEAPDKILMNLDQFMKKTEKLISGEMKAAAEAQAQTEQQAGPPMAQEMPPMDPMMAQEMPPPGLPPPQVA